MKRILAIETATLFSGVALISDQGVIAEHNAHVRASHSERLMPIIGSLLSDGLGGYELSQEKSGGCSACSPCSLHSWQLSQS